MNKVIITENPGVYTSMTIAELLNLPMATLMKEYPEAMLEVLSNVFTDQFNLGHEIGIIADHVFPTKTLGEVLNTATISDDGKTILMFEEEFLIFTDADIVLQTEKYDFIADTLLTDVPTEYRPHIDFDGWFTNEFQDKLFVVEDGKMTNPIVDMDTCDVQCVGGGLDMNVYIVRFK